MKEKANNYHDYVIKNGSLIGKFEEMYRECENPWPETEEDLENLPVSTRTAQIINQQQFGKILSIGSGKGFHLNWLSRKCPSSTFTGCDISTTAIAHAQEHYPHIRSEVLDISDFEKHSWDFDLILFREIVWYILAEWDRVIKNLREQYSGKYIIVELSFYDSQSYGLERFNGPDEFVEKFPFEIIEVVRYHVTRQQREGMIMVYGRIK